MKFITAAGKVKAIKGYRKYLIDWDGKSPSKGQKRVKDFLKDYWAYDSVFEELPVAGTRLRFDFYNASRKIVVEYSPSQHFTYVKHFHKSREGFLKAQERDWQKLEFCNLNGIALIEVLNEGEINEDFFAEHGVI